MIIFIEVMIESIYGGFEWLPMNPVITDSSNRLFRDYKVIIEPQAANSAITIKYLIAGVPKDVEGLTFFEEGLSQDGKKAYRLFLRNVPLE
jgi:hypothetical protein